MSTHVYCTSLSCVSISVILFYCSSLQLSISYSCVETLSKDPKIVKKNKQKIKIIHWSIISLNVCVKKLQMAKNCKIQRTKKRLFISFHVFFLSCMFHNYCLLSHYITCLPFNRWLDSNYLFAKSEIYLFICFLSWSTSHHQKISKKKNNNPMGWFPWTSCECGIRSMCVTYTHIMYSLSPASCCVVVVHVIVCSIYMSYACICKTCSATYYVRELGPL